MRILITAGPTREYIDPVRYLSNESSGKMGVALVAAAAARGHRVTLIHGPIAVACPAGVRAVAVTSAADMLRACLAAWTRQDVLIMAAAVADYAPARTEPAKRKKSPRDLTLRLVPTVDILAALSAARRTRQVAIGFALEDRHGRRNAAAKLARKKLDAIVLNAPSALSADRAQWQILTAAEGWQRVPPGPKPALAVRLIRLAERLHAAKSDD